MCDPPKGRPHKYLDESYHHGPTRGYQPQAPMATGAVGGAGAYAAGRSTMASHSPPQYAEFDVSKKGPAHEDALPEMPTWESASKKKVLVEDDSAVEMDQLKKPPGTADAASVSSQMPLMSGASPGPSSPQSPNRGPYGNLGPGGGSYGQDPAYGSGPSFQGQDQGYGVAGAAPVAGAAAHGRNSPHGGYYNANGGRDPYGNGYGQNPSYDQNAGYRSVSPHHGAAYDDGYGRQSPSPVGNGHYAAAASYDRRSPVPPRGGPGAAGYDSAASSYRGIQPSNPHQQHHAQRQYSTDSMRTGGGYSHAPLPQQQPQHQNNGPYPLNLHNSGGFDFVGSSGYSRPGAAQAVNGYDAYGGGPPRPHNDGAGRGW